MHLHELCRNARRSQWCRRINSACSIMTPAPRDATVSASHLAVAAGLTHADRLAYTNTHQGETVMRTRRSVMLSLALSMLATAPAWSASAMKMLDPDNDGTIDLAEAKAAASKLFDRLDGDKDGTLDRRELRGRVSKAEFAAANPDNDGTLDKNEYLALVERRFIAANPDNDGTIDARELASPAGKALLKLLR